MFEYFRSEEHFKSTDVVRDIIIGMSDGLTVPFALAAGLSGAVDHTSIIVVAGLAEIVAGSISMGLGGYLAGTNDADHYWSEMKREYKEVKEVPEMEKEEVVELLGEYGITRDEVQPILNHFEKDHDMWVKFMMRNELRLEEPHPHRAAWSAGTIALSYIVGGVVPLTPYLFITVPHEALLVSSLCTLVALTIFGYVKSKVIGVNPWKGAFRTAIIGTVAAGAAYTIARYIA